jgi:hypothetical protein
LHWISPPLRLLTRNLCEAMASSEKADTVDRNSEVKVGHYGSRRSDKFIRHYPKRCVNAYRVEGQFNSSFLRKHKIDSEQDLVDVAREFCPSHIRFVQIRWSKLAKYLRRKFGKTESKLILRGAEKRAASIRRVARYLRRKGVLNVHRFYKDLEINKDIERALENWATRFEDERQKARQRSDRAKGKRRHQAYD